MNARLVNSAADVIARAMANGRRTPAGLATALESAQLLQSPETAAELEQLRARLAESEQRSERRRIAWRMARQRAISVGGAADRYAAHARAGQTALQDMLVSLLATQIERDEARAKVAELEAQVAELEHKKELEDRERVELLTGLERALAPFCVDAKAAAVAAAEVRHCEAEWLLRDAQRSQDRVTELEAERHSTNEALSDAAEALRADRDRTAELEALLQLTTVLEIPRPGQLPLQIRLAYGHDDRWMICDREGRRWHREHGWVFEPQGIRDEALRDASRFQLAEAVPLARRLADVDSSADKLTRLLEPVQAPREDPHDGPLAHPYRLGRDLPQAGGR